MQNQNNSPKELQKPITPFNPDNFHSDDSGFSSNDKIQNEKDDLYNKFLGNKQEYDKINNEMRKIYQVRIDAWKKLIN